MIDNDTSNQKPETHSAAPADSGAPMRLRAEPPRVTRLSRKVLATADASAERVRSRETTTSWPSRPFFSEASFIVGVSLDFDRYHFGCFDLPSKCFFSPCQQST